jgi:hypothetical protein
VLDLNAVFRVKNNTFVTRKVGDEMVIVPLVNSVADMTRVLTLNETGAEILEALDGKNTLNVVILKLLDVFDVNEEIFKKDIELFITEAVERRLIERVD